MSDLSFSELSVAGNSCCSVVGGKVFIDVSLLIGEPVAALSSLGVFETLAKLLLSAYEAQEEKNELLASGSKLGAISPPASNVPTLDGGVIVATTEYSMRLKYSLNLDNPTSPVS